MKESVHFIGAGGVGMSALAHILLQKGAHVSGSDLAKSEATCALEVRGAQIAYEHRHGTVKKGQRIVYSTAIRESNPEILDAREMGCSIIHRSELLREQMVGKQSIIVSGSHGKTTITSLLSYTLLEAGLDPSFAIGGFCPSLETHGRFGKGAHFVAEGDESDGSFLRTTPFGAILTSVDFDHFNYWQTKERMIDGFKEFIGSVQNRELFLYWGDDPYMASWGLEGIGYGFSERNRLRISNLRFEGGNSLFDINFDGMIYKDVQFTMLGRHNALNATAAFGMALLLGGGEMKVREALKNFKGVKRRLEFKGKVNGAPLYDDYAHHPNEIRATLASLSEMAGKGRIVAVFQAHRYTRTRDFGDEIAEALVGPHELVVTDIYAASEDPIVGVTTDTFVSKIRERRGVTYAPLKELPALLLKIIKPTDIVVTMSAGNSLYDKIL